MAAEVKVVRLPQTVELLPVKVRDEPWLGLVLLGVAPYLPRETDLPAADVLLLTSPRDEPFVGVLPPGGVASDEPPSDVRERGTGFDERRIL